MSVKGLTDVNTDGIIRYNSETCGVEKLGID